MHDFGIFCGFGIFFWCVWTLLWSLFLSVLSIFLLPSASLFSVKHFYVSVSNCGRAVFSLWLWSRESRTVDVLPVSLSQPEKDVQYKRISEVTLLDWYYGGNLVAATYTSIHKNHNHIIQISRPHKGTNKDNVKKVMNTQNAQITCKFTLKLFVMIENDCRTWNSLCSFSWWE